MLLFDEPVNGLDPEGIRWIRELMRALAAEGRTVLVSSHLMSEMALTADHLVIIGRGRLIADTVGAAPWPPRYQRGVLVRSPRAAELAGRAAAQAARRVARGAGRRARRQRPGRRRDRRPGRAATASPLHELTPRSASLEEAYLELTADSVDYRAGGR